MKTLTVGELIEKLKKCLNQLMYLCSQIEQNQTEMKRTLNLYVFTGLNM